MEYFCLPREITETIQNFPVTKKVWREVTFFLKDGSQRADCVVIGNEFYAMDTNKHVYFEPADISFVEQS